MSVLAAPLTRCKWELSEFDATKNEVSIETLDVRRLLFAGQLLSDSASSLAK